MIAIHTEGDAHTYSDSMEKQRENMYTKFKRQFSADSGLQPPEGVLEL